MNSMKLTLHSRFLSSPPAELPDQSSNQQESRRGDHTTGGQREGRHGGDGLQRTGCGEALLSGERQ